MFFLYFVLSRGVRTDASLVPPIRQTASIFKQPVTVYKTQEGKVKSDFKQGPQDKPKQVKQFLQSNLKPELIACINQFETFKIFSSFGKNAWKALEPVMSMDLNWMLWSCLRV